MTEPQPMTDRAEQASRPWLKVVVGFALLGGFVLLAKQAGGYLPQFAQWVEGLGFWGPAVFVAGYAIAVAALIPGSVLTLAGGAIFGLAAGTSYVFVAAVLGSCAGFLIARHAARGFVEKRLEAQPRFELIDRAVAEQGLKITFLLRLSPLFPFSFLNYALGLTRVNFRDYALASFGMLPGTLLYVYYGKLIGDVAALASGAAPDRDAGYYAVLGLGLVATLAVTTIVTRIARRALAEATEDQAAAG